MSLRTICTFRLCWMTRWTAPSQCLKAARPARKARFFTTLKTKSLADLRRNTQTDHSSKRVPKNFRAALLRNWPALTWALAVSWRLSVQSFQA